MNQQHQPQETQPIKGITPPGISEQTLPVSAEPSVTTEEVDAIYAEMEQNNQRMMKQAKRVVWFMYGFVAFMGLYGLLILPLYFWWGISLPIWTTFLWISFPLVIMAPLIKETGQPFYLQALDRLADSDDMRAVGALASMLLHTKGQRRRKFIATLTRLLPRLNATDAALFPPRLQARLYYLLKPEYSHKLADFQVAVLKALEQVGDREALPHVKRLADMTPTTVNEQRVREAAEECVIYLQQRADQEHSKQTLLRAAKRSEHDPNALLRPAAGANIIETEHLLKAGSPEDKP